MFDTTADDDEGIATDATTGAGTDQLTLAMDAAATGRPADCECLDATEALPCFTCWRAGFEAPNPAEPARTIDE